MAMETQGKGSANGKAELTAGKGKAELTSAKGKAELTGGGSAKGKAELTGGMIGSFPPDGLRPDSSNTE